MPDREKVKTELDAIVDECRGCDYVRFAVVVEHCTNILELLKEQEAVEPNVNDINDHDAHGSWWYQCGKCGMPIDYGDRFCRHCGREVKWND